MQMSQFFSIIFGQYIPIDRSNSLGFILVSKRLQRNLLHQGKVSPNDGKHSRIIKKNYSLRRLRELLHLPHSLKLNLSYANLMVFFRNFRFVQICNVICYKLLNFNILQKLFGVRFQFFFFSSFMIKVPITQKPVHSFAEQINGLVSI